MCMLCVVPPHVIPSKDKLENSALNNPDGFGFAIAIRKENRIHVETTMNPDTSIKRFLEMRAKYPEGYAMWHARMATHGSTNIDNCHPFKVGGDNRTYLGHNGVLGVMIPQGDKRSDTRIFAEDVLPAMGGVKALDNPQIFNVIEDFCSGSKVCILTIDPDAKAECYLLNEKDGKEDESGVWWSNDSCKLDYYGTSWYSRKSLSHFFHDDYESAYGVARNSTLSEDGLDVEYTCSVCRLEGVMSAEKWKDALYCSFCFSCFDCAQEAGDCLCYSPSKYEKEVEYQASLELEAMKRDIQNNNLKEQVFQDLKDRGVGC